MSLPTKTGVQTLDYSYRGQPWCRVAAKSGIDLDVLDTSYQGQPWWGISEGAVIQGTVCWGHSTGVTETNVRTFASNWTGTGAILNGDLDAERVELNALEYMISEPVNTGVRYIELLQNVYNGLGDDVLLHYRTGDSVVNCELDSWHAYVGHFISDGYVEVRIMVA